MYELTDLEGLILSVIYSDLLESSNAKYNQIKDEVEQEIVRNTNYTADLINDSANAEIKDQLRRPFAWILEYYALAMINDLSELQEKRIFKNYQEALEMLQTFPRYYDEYTEGQENSSNTFDCNGVVSW